MAFFNHHFFFFNGILHAKDSIDNIFLHINQMQTTMLLPDKKVTPHLYVARLAVTDVG